jgi:hypothetical protein
VLLILGLVQVVLLLIMKMMLFVGTVMKAPTSLGFPSGGRIGSLAFVDASLMGIAQSRRAGWTKHFIILPAHLDTARRLLMQSLHHALDQLVSLDDRERLDSSVWKDVRLRRISVSSHGV